MGKHKKIKNRIKLCNSPRTSLYNEDIKYIRNQPLRNIALRFIQAWPNTNYPDGSPAMTIFEDYQRATSLDDALQALQAPPPVKIIAGGTDLILKATHGNGDPCTLVDVSDLPELLGIETLAEGLRIGASTRMSALEQAPELSGALSILAEGAHQVGSPQIRNLATLGGNICNASPSADSAAPLLALGAEVELCSASGPRRIALDQFFTGPGASVLAEDELLCAVHIPLPRQGAVGRYLKLAVRKAMDLAIVGVAVMLWRVDGRYAGRIALAAVAPTPIRALKAEAMLAESETLDEAAIDALAQLAKEAASPIDDVRGSARYRKDMVHTLTARALAQAIEELSR
jgi:CO/xanthine dehydrogenase FAD-binding subunit